MVNRQFFRSALGPAIDAHAFVPSLYLLPHVFRDRPPRGATLAGEALIGRSRPLRFGAPVGLGQRLQSKLILAPAKRLHRFPELEEGTTPFV